MVPIADLHPGMRVKIVDQWVDGCYQNDKGLMDKYLGQIVTILETGKHTAYIEEDAGDCGWHRGGHWEWLPESFDYIVEGNEYADFELASDSEIFSLFRK